MSATAQDASLPYDGICPICDRNLVVHWECGRCDFYDPNLEPREADGRKLGSWSRRKMIIFSIITLIAPMFGFWAAYVASFDRRTRKQGLFLVVVIAVSEILVQPLILKLIDFLANSQ